MEVEWQTVISKLSMRIAQLEVDLAVMTAALEKLRETPEGTDEGE